ncbi:phospholipase A2 [Streptomyces sp. NPDC055078]
MKFDRKSPLGATLVSAALLASALAGTAGSAGTAAAAETVTAGNVSATAGRASLKRKADRIMNLTYQQFARTKRVKPFNWTSDGCSTPKKNFPYRGRFKKACNQHDFGYRNYGAKGKLELSPTKATRKKIDAKFLNEMKRTCADVYKGGARTKCKVAAVGYHRVVRIVSAKNFGYR